MRYGIIRLRHHPFSYRDLVLEVAQTQRFYMDTLTYVTFIKDGWHFKLYGDRPAHILHREYLGAWTTEAEVVQRLYHVGLPVYFVRHTSTIPADMNIYRPSASFVMPTELVENDWLGNGGEPLLSLCHNGPPGDDRHAAMCILNKYEGLASLHYDLDGNKHLVPVGKIASVEFHGGVDENKRGSSRSRRKKGPYMSRPDASKKQHQSMSRDKFAEITGDLVPPVIPAWSSAFTLIDKSKPLHPKPHPDYFGYRFPEPGMMLFGERRERYLFNWLLVRDANFARLLESMERPTGIPAGTSNENWKAYLNCVFSAADTEGLNALEDACVDSKDLRIGTDDVPHNTARKLAAFRIFGASPLDKLHAEVKWHGFTIQFGTLLHHNAVLAEEILWDVFEHSFRFDLLALDMLLAQAEWQTNSIERMECLRSVFPGEGSFFVDKIPHKNEGLAADDWSHKFVYLNNLARVMRSWPDQPSCVFKNVEANAENTTTLENNLVTFYCQTLYEYFGRPPILPR